MKALLDFKSSELEVDAKARVACEKREVQASKCLSGRKVFAGQA